jgi:hypothetical protein
VYMPARLVARIAASWSMWTARLWMSKLEPAPTSPPVPQLDTQGLIRKARCFADQNHPTKYYEKYQVAGACNVQLYRPRSVGS